MGIKDCFCLFRNIMHTVVHTKKSVCMNLHREKAVDIDLMGFVPIFFVCKLLFEKNNPTRLRAIKTIKGH